jgi:acetyl-CoA synthetase (ADP-forming)/acetyltransferase
MLGRAGCSLRRIKRRVMGQPVQLTHHPPMSIRHLDFLFNPASVAVIGASDRPGSVGAMVWRQLRAGGFQGPVWAVNPGHARIGDQTAFASVAALPAAPELALICTPAATLPGLIAKLGRRGTRAAVVLTAAVDSAVRQAMLDAARPHLLRVLGADSLGLQAPHIGLNASLAPVAARPGRLACVSQSGALAASLLDWADGLGIGFSQVVTVGDQVDVDFGDVLDWLSTDAGTRAIVLAIESIRSPRKFMSAARATARNKPVVVVKAGPDAVFDAAIRRAGMLRVDSLQELYTAAETLARMVGTGADTAEDSALTIVGNGSGASLMAADAAAATGVALAVLSPASRKALDAALPPTWSRANLVNLPGDAPPALYVTALRILLADAASGRLLLVLAPTAMVPALAIAAALLPLLLPAAARMLVCWLGGTTVAPARQCLQRAGIACHETPEQAVAACAMLAAYRRNQAELTQAPPSAAATGGPDFGAVRASVEAVLAAGRDLLTAAEARDLLLQCGIPVAAHRFHARASELSVGTRIDALFGPVIRFGAGGTAADGPGGHAIALPPLNRPLALALVQRTRVGRQLHSADDSAAADLDPLLALLQTLSQLLAEVPELAEVDIDPLLADRHGVVALGIHVRLDASRPAGAANFAIRPYPHELTESVAWKGRSLTLRPVRPEDEAQHLAFLSRLEPQDIRMRIFYTRRSIQRSELARLIQIDYEREMAFIATAAGPDGSEETLAVVRAVCDPDNVSAEFGIVVRSDLKGSGLGLLLLHKMIAYLRTRGTRELMAVVLADNQRMLDLARELGFVVAHQTSDGTCDVRLSLVA